MTAFLRPTDPGYDDEVAGYNRLVVHRPELVMPARSVADVVEAVRTAAAAGLPLGVQATGHGPSVPADGVLVSTRHLRDVRVDPATPHRACRRGRARPRPHRRAGAARPRPAGRVLSPRRCR